MVIVWMMQADRTLDDAGWPNLKRCGAVMKTSNLEDVNVGEILDRVLDKGIVIDPSARVSLMGQDLHAMRSRVVVESVNTFL